MLYSGWLSDDTLDNTFIDLSDTQADTFNDFMSDNTLIDDT